MADERRAFGRGGTPVTIVAYHAVDPAWRAPLSVDPRTFERQVRWLATARRCVSLRDVIDEPADGRRIAITFDDGFSSVYEHALPVLRRWGVPSTVFVIGRTLDDPTVDWVDRPPRHPLRVLERTQILEMHAEGVGIGSHSYAHADLTSLGYAGCVDDLRRSREVLEDLIRAPVTLLAYPRGRHDAAVRAAARDAGFERAFALPVPQRATGPFAVPRVGVYPSDRPATLALKTTPWYGAVRGSVLYRKLRPLLARR